MHSSPTDRPPVGLMAGTFAVRVARGDDRAQRRSGARAFAACAVLFALPGCAKDDPPGVTDVATPPSGVSSQTPGLEGGLDGDASDGSIAVLASGLQPPAALALDATYVYFTQTSTADAGPGDGGIDAGLPSTGQVLRVPRAGGRVELLAHDRAFPAGIAVLGDTLAWGNQGSGPATGGVEVLAPRSNPPVASARSISTGESVGPALAVDGQSVYWSASLLGAGFVVERAPLATLAASGPIVVGTTIDPFVPAGLARAEDALYVVANDVDGALYRSDLAGGNLENLATVHLGRLRDVVAVRGAIYFVDARPRPDGAIWQLATGAAGAGVAHVFAGDLDRPSHLAQDGATLYVTLEGDRGAVLAYSVVADGGIPGTAGVPRALASPLVRPSPIVVASDALYVGVSDGLVRIPK